MSQVAFLVDECLPSSVNRGLQRRIPDASVVRVGGESAPPISSSDALLLRYCEQEHCVLVTADRSSMPREIEQHRDAGNKTWGVFIIRPGSSLVRLLDELELVYATTEAEEWVNQREYIPF